MFRDDVGDHAKWAKQFNAIRIMHRDEVEADTEAVEVKLEGEGPWTLQAAAGAGAGPGGGATGGGAAAAAGNFAGSPTQFAAVASAAAAAAAGGTGATDKDERGDCFGHKSSARTAATDVAAAGGGGGAIGSKCSAGDNDVLILHTPGHTRGHCCLLYTPDQALFTGDHVGGPYPYNTQGLGELTLTVEFVKFDLGQQVASMEGLLRYDWLHVLPGHGRPVRFEDARHRLSAVRDMLSRYVVDSDVNAD